MVREDRQVRMRQIEAPERVPDRLHAAIRLLGNLLGDLRSDRARLGQTPRSLDNPLAPSSVNWLNWAARRTRSPLRATK